MARLMPRVRRAGSATSTPSSAVTATAPTRAARKGHLRSATRRAAIRAPKPARTYWASESCPAYPVTSTMDTHRIAKPMVTVTALVQAVSNTEETSQAMTAVTTTVGMIRTLPEPTSIMRSSTWLRSGMPRPRSTITTTTMMKGTLADQPGALT
ncbi:hypothetical protein SHIRM173S_13273 [Streptomyces hirsutus]